MKTDRFSLVALGLALAAAAAMLAAGLGTRAELWHFRTGLLVFRFGAIGAIAAFGLALPALLRTRPGSERAGLAAALTAFMLSGVMSAGAAVQFRRFQTLPVMHDISTDLAEPPAFEAALPLREGGNPVTRATELAGMQRAAYPDIGPLVLDAPPAVAYERALAAVKAMGWEILAADAARLRIEAVDTSLLFGFKDDVVVRIRAAGVGSRVDVRSISRVGKSDLGVNARRVRAYLERLRKTAAD